MDSSSAKPVTGEAEAAKLAGFTESEYLEQIERGFRGLSFAAKLEREFRKYYTDQMRWRVFCMIMLLIAFAVYKAFATMAEGAGAVSMPNAESADAFSKSRNYLLIPFFLSMLATGLWRPLYVRYWTIVGPICLIITSTIVAPGAVIKVAEGNHHVFLSLALGLFQIYGIAGLIFWRAVTVCAVITVTYFYFLLGTDVSPDIFLYELVQMIMLNTTGIVLSYTLEHTARSEFLRSRLLEHLSSRDALTGLSNRRSFTQHLDRLWAQGIRERQTVGLLLLDVDFFKRYNDHYGHQAGDDCLKKVGAVLAKLERRPLDMAARVGGEEFAVLTYAAHREHLEQLAQQVIEEIRAAGIPHAASGVSAFLTVSVGTVLTTPDSARSAKGLYQFADQMLYKAKEQGRNRVQLGEQSLYEGVVTGRFIASAAAR